MKYISFLFISFVRLLVGSGALAASVHDYGLYFHSHAVPAAERSSLFLDDGLPFSVQNEFALSFRMFVRSNEPDYGSILHLTTDVGQTIHFSLVGSEEKHLPALVLNEGIVYIDTPITRERWVDVSVHLRCKDNVVEVEYADKHTSAMVPLKGMRSVTASFGVMQGHQADVAPVNIKDVCVWQEGKQTREWKLRKHKGDDCYDDLRQKVAHARFPFWLIDNHIEWKMICHHTVQDRLDVVFDAREARFYLVGDHSVKVLDSEGVLQREIQVRGGYPATNYANHMLFDTLANSIVSYSQRQGNASVFTLSDGIWSCGQLSSDEPRYYNHARTFNPADSSFYFFGGYGFYQYRNELYRMKSGSEVVERVEYERPFYPRFSAAMGGVGDDLFIFGGRGNKYGKQELTSEYYYGLCALNLKTNQSRLIWKRLQSTENTIMASSMYFEPSDSSFYAFSMDKGGVLWKVSMADSICQEVSKPIGNLSSYQDLDLNLYASASKDKLFVVMDKIQSNRTHDLSIYSINLPLLDELEIMQAEPSMLPAGSRNRLYWALLLVPLAGLVFFIWMRRHRNKNVLQAASCSRAENGQLPFVAPHMSREEDSGLQTVGEKAQDSSSQPAYYDRTRSAINLLGCFSVYDKEGNDITSSFTPRLKHLLILLVLYTEKSPQGILSSRITEILWPDKEEVSARNNRNVSLRKLRVLLENIGDVSIVTENNFLRVNWGDEVFCDYHTLLKCIRDYRKCENEEVLDRILELLLCGPLLPNTILDWLDNFKDSFSSSSIDLLRNLLEIEVKRGHQEMVIRLTNIIFLHDPLNEEALSAKCAVLSAQGKKGIAHNVYDRFCREYRESMGEDYKVPFSAL